MNLEKQKRRNQELLDEVVFEFVLCMFRDLMHITLLFILKCDQSCSSKFEDFVHNSKKDKCMEKDAVRLAYISKHLLKGLMQSGPGGLGVVLYMGHPDCVSEKLPMCDFNINDTEKKTTKLNEKTKATFPVLFAILMLCLKYASLQFDWTVNQLSPIAFLEVNTDTSVYLYHEIDTSKLHNVNGISFFQFPRVVKKIQIGDNHNLAGTYKRTTSPLKTSFHTVLVSNSTATGTLLSLEDKLLNKFVFVYRLLLYAVVLAAPILVRSSPIKDKETKQREQRSVQRSFVVDLKGAPNTGYCADMSFGKSVSTTQEVDFVYTTLY